MSCNTAQNDVPGHFKRKELTKKYDGRAKLTLYTAFDVRVPVPNFLTPFLLTRKHFLDM